MKLSLLFLITITFVMNANSSYSQKTKISMNLGNVTVEEVIDEIEANTEFKFIFNTKTIDLKRKVSINVKKVSIDQVLKTLFTNSHVAYNVEDRKILLTKNEPVPKAREQLSESVKDSMKIQFQVNGTILDANGEPLAAANVVEKGTTNGVMADFNGNFTIEVTNENAILIVSYIGFITQEMAINGRSSVSLTLVEDTANLDEVVVVGYGSQKKATLTGAISAVKGDDITSTPTTNASQMITGRLSGVTTMQRSGEPGADDAIIRIRGISTLGDSNPLIVVDGVPGRSFSRIDPNSIENITVLKDASAAIYGSQAANGVILITTKRGKTGKPEITINLNQGYNQPTVIPKMANGSEYATLLNELDIYSGRPPRYTDEEIAQFTSGTDPWLYPNTDWFKEVLKPWSSQNNVNAQIRGGSDNFKYFLSGGSKFQDAYYHNSVSNYKQYDIRANIDTQISEYIKIGFDMYGRMENRRSPTRGYGTIFRTTTLGNPNVHAKWPDGSPGPDIIEGSNPITISTDAAGYDNNKIYSLNSSLKLDFKVPGVEGLSVNGSANLDKSFQNRKRWEIPWEVNSWDKKTYDADGKPVLSSAMVPFNDPRLTQYMYDNQSLLLNAIINYEKSIDVHNLGFMVGVESRKGEGNNFNAFRRHYASTTLPELFAGGGQDKDNGGSAYENARLNYFGRVNYRFDEKYLLEFLWRYDGSYIFPQDNRFGFFPGVSLGWRISEEQFWKDNLKGIEEFKLRASYGQTGNDRIDEWQYLSSYAYSDFVYNFGITNGNKILYEARIPNKNVTWEVADQFNIGFESYFLDRRLFVEFDYFDYRRSNILWWRNASVPASTGLTLPRENIGKVANKGVDFSISYQDKIQNLGYSISLNGGYATNKITFWDEVPGIPEWQRSTGKPIPTFSDVNNDLYYEAIGIFRDQAHVDSYPHWENAQPGDIIFRDVNGDNKIDGLDRVRNEKNNIPKFTGGMSLGLTYKQFSLSSTFQGAAGAVRYISTESGQIGNFLKEFYDERWTPDNPDAKGPRAYNRDAEYWRNNRNTYFLKKSDYIRLKTLEIGYLLPSSLNTKLGVSTFKVYISGYNLFTVSPDIKDFDPESEQTSLSGQSQPYPAQRVINGGISLTL